MKIGSIISATVTAFVFVASCVPVENQDPQSVLNLDALSPGGSIVLGSPMLTVSSQAELDELLGSSSMVDIVGVLRLTASDNDQKFDFRGREVRYAGNDTRCESSRIGHRPFIELHGNRIALNNIIINRSAPDGIDVSSNSSAELSNVIIRHSCDEAITLREGASITIDSSYLASHDNKAIMFKGDNTAYITNSHIVSEQAFSLDGFRLHVIAENTRFERHPDATFGRIITGDNCGSISIELHSSTLQGIDHIDGTIDCSDVSILVQ